jgi:hypothetical protein
MGKPCNSSSSWGVPARARRRKASSAREASPWINPGLGRISPLPLDDARTYSELDDSICVVEATRPSPRQRAAQQASAVASAVRIRDALAIEVILSRPHGDERRVGLINLVRIEMDADALSHGAIDDLADELRVEAKRRRLDRQVAPGAKSRQRVERSEAGVRDGPRRFGVAVEVTERAGTTARRETTASLNSVRQPAAADEETSGHPDAQAHDRPRRRA